MAGTIDVDALADEVMKGLTECTDLTDDKMKAVGKKAGNTVKTNISANAPKRTGKYATSWRAKTTKETANAMEVTVYSPTRYMHLLEHGHAKRGGGRVAGKAHIAPAAEAGEQELLDEIERALG